MLIMVIFFKKYQLKKGRKDYLMNDIFGMYFFKLLRDYEFFMNEKYSIEI
jgi:hypothetical protein